MKKGFTLVELIIVIAVIAGIAGITLLSVRSGSDKALDVTRRSDLKQYQVALEVYANRNNNKYPNRPGRLNDICPDLNLLNCPENSINDYYYQPLSDGYGYYIWSELEQLSQYGEDTYYVVCSSGQSAETQTKPDGDSCPVSDLPPTPTPIPLPTNTPVPSETEESGNLIANGSFENGSTSWSWYSNGSTNFSVISGGIDGSRMALVKKTSSGGNNIQLFQTNIKMSPNKNYKLTLSARANSASSFSIFLHKHGSPYTNYGLSNYQINISSQWQNFTINFTSTNSASTDARLRLWFVNSPVGEINIDNIILVEL